MGVIQGKKRIDGLFRCATLEQQQDYFDRKWNTVQWRLLFKLLANKRMLANRGLTADYFKFDDGSSSFPGEFSSASQASLMRDSGRVQLLPGAIFASALPE